jgi:hypothetical protein
VIPGDDLLVSQPLALHRWTKIVLQKVAFLFRRVNARLPPLRSHRFVLNGDSPDWDSFRMICLDEPRVVIRPGLVELGLELAAVQNIVVVFHECRRAPRTREDIQPSATGGQHFLDKRYAEFLVVSDAERLQLFVALIDVRVTTTREVATVNVGARQLVANTAGLVEMRIEKFALFGLWQHGKRLRRSIGQSSANTQKGLKLPAGIDKDADLRFLRLADCFETQRVSGGNPVISFVGGRVNGDLFLRR